MTLPFGVNDVFPMAATGRADVLGIRREPVEKRALLIYITDLY